MHHLRMCLGLAAVVIGCFQSPARAQENDADQNQYHLRVFPFEALSEHNVSRQGDAALQLTEVAWQHSESDHFIFHTETGFAITQLVTAAEWSYAGIKKDLGIEQDSFERKCHVYVFLNEAVWRKFVLIGKLEAWTGGWCTGRELFFWSRPNFKFQGHTLPHELTHLVVHRFIEGDIPLWLNEGLAEFEGLRLSRAYLKVRGDTMLNTRDRLAKEEYLPLGKLTEAVDYTAKAEMVRPFYTESQRLVSFLYYQYGGMEPLLKFLKLQAHGARFDSAFQEIYSSRGLSAEQFEDKFITFVTKSTE